AAALRLVRELLCSPSRDVIADASFLEQARTVLRASGLFLVAGGGEAPVALAAVAGSPPSAGLLERAGQLPPAGDAAHQPWVLCMSENGWLATAAARLGADPLRLAAWWDQDAEPAAWQREMLLCLASSVADRPAIERSSCAAAGVTGLRFP